LSVQVGNSLAKGVNENVHENSIEQELIQ